MDLQTLNAQLMTAAMQGDAANARRLLAAGEVVGDQPAVHSPCLG